MLNDNNSRPAPMAYKLFQDLITSIGDVSSNPVAPVTRIFIKQIHLIYFTKSAYTD